MDDKQLKKILKRGVSEIIQEEEFIKLLKSGKPIRLKQGFDPSRPDIHLGHVVGLKKLRQLQDLGHKVILIVGDWTAQIGDPSGASITRPMLTAEEVKSNAQSYMTQFFKVVDPEKTEVKWQSEWFGKFTLADVLKLTSKFTVAQFLARDDFRKRFEEQRPIAITELLYPLLQAYDSIEIRSDVEFGGTDQMFNCLVGRELQQMEGQRPQQVFLMPILVGTDGKQKMSKSLDNYIGVEEPPNDMYGKVMSMPDEVIITYFELITDVDDDEIEEFKKQLTDGSVHPMDLKKRLAFEIVMQFHDEKAACDADAHFSKVVQQKELPDEIQEAKVSFKALATDKEGEIRLPELLLATGLVDSKGEARRMLAQGAVQIDGNKATDASAKIENGSIVKVGKRRIRKIINTD
ncbi:MAG: tyrosine--tRNA ligase [Chloroflexi bacterium]|jgi:tyrosyl-tRNA synthetase|nr:tyrosine--tRNA ligase [Chloroflexota bacterium]MBT7080107.1 tyrosine--tRNA ligase [Chloroflexota bacterium]